MFSKSSKTAFICLRCQSRFLCLQASCPPPRRLRPSAPAIRWLSTAVARLEEEDEYDDPRPHEDSKARDTTSERRRPKKRKWRHSHVAELGVPALGKPAEVLVLQPRDRRIPKVPVDNDRENMPPPLTEAVEAELAPLNPEDVKENIEQTKKPFGDEGRMLEQEQWKTLKDNLMKGFTHLQLLGYIREMEMTSNPSSANTEDARSAAQSIPISAKSLKDAIDKKSNLNRGGRRVVKYLAASHIMKDIWGFSLPLDEVEIEDKTTATIRLPSHQINTLLASQALRQVAEVHKAKIDIYSKERNSLVFGGSKTAVTEAKKAVAVLKGQIKSISIDLGKAKHRLPGLRDVKFENELLQEVIRKRSVYVDQKDANKSGGVLRISFLQKDQKEAEAARRDMLLAGSGPRHRSRFSISPPLKQQLSWLIPYNSWNTFPWWEAHRRWGRWGYLPDADKQQAEATAKTETPTAQQAKEIYMHLQGSKLKPEISAHSKQEYKAFLGLTLFPRNTKPGLQRILAEHEDSKQPNPTPRLYVDVPLLAQFLKSCKPWPITNNIAIVGKQQAPSKQGFIHRLHLLPSETSSLAPAIEVYLSGEDVNMMLRQPLRILRIAAILEERSHFLLQPQLVVDLQLLKRTKYDFYHLSRRRNPKNDQFNSQFLRYLNLAQGQDVPSFAPFVKLSIPTDLLDRFTPSVVPLEKSDKATSEPPSKRAKSVPKCNPTEYMLAASETVEVTSFSHPNFQDICLDHIHFHDLEGSGGRQQLRLSNQPLLDMSDGVSANFSKVFQGACVLASRLGDPKLLKERA